MATNSPKLYPSFNRPTNIKEQLRAERLYGLGKKELEKTLAKSRPSARGDIAGGIRLAKEQAIAAKAARAAAPTAMKKGGAVKKAAPMKKSSDAMGRAVKRKTADVKGRAMKKGK